MNSEELILWKKNNNELLEKIDNWRNSYSCEYNCNDWEKWKFCKHLRKNMVKKFNKEITKQINKLITINNVF